jgi:hypothetical protein
MSDLDETRFEEDEGNPLRNTGGAAADAEADAHGDHLARPTDVEYGDDDVPAAE